MSPATVVSFLLRTRAPPAGAAQGREAEASTQADVVFLVVAGGQGNLTSGSAAGPGGGMGVQSDGDRGEERAFMAGPASEAAGVSWDSAPGWWLQAAGLCPLSPQCVLDKVREVTPHVPTTPGTRSMLGKRSRPSVAASLFLQEDKTSSPPLPGPGSSRRARTPSRRLAAARQAGAPRPSALAAQLQWPWPWPGSQMERRGGPPAFSSPGVCPPSVRRVSACCSSVLCEPLPPPSGGVLGLGRFKED